MLADLAVAKLSPIYFSLHHSPLHDRPCGGDPEPQALSEVVWMAGTSPAMER